MRAKVDDSWYWFQNTTISPTSTFTRTWDWLILTAAGVVSIMYPYIATFIAHNLNVDANSANSQQACKIHAYTEC